MKPKATVVLPTYNRCKILPRAVESILTQSMPDLELIIINDGSTDKTGNLLKEYCRIDSRVKSYDLPINCGQSIARAIGNRCANSEYIFVMDSDDRALPDRIKVQLDFMKKNPHIMISGSNSLKLQNGSSMRMKMLENDSDLKSILIMIDSAFVHPTLAIRTEFMKQNRINYSSQKRIADDDYEFYITSVAHKAVFANIPDITLEYHRHSSNLTKTTPSHQHDKKSLRKRILSLYFPDESAIAIDAVTNAMQKNASISRAQAKIALCAIERMRKLKTSHFNENKKLLGQILAQYQSKIIDALQD